MVAFIKFTNSIMPMKQLAYICEPYAPIRYEIENIGTVSSSSTLEQICCAVSSEGGYTLPGDDTPLLIHGRRKRLLLRAGRYLQSGLKRNFQQESQIGNR